MAQHEKIWNGKIMGLSVWAKFSNFPFYFREVSKNQHDKRINGFFEDCTWI